MQITNDLKELSKEKCSKRGCKNKAVSIIERVLYCRDCKVNLKQNKIDSEWWKKFISKK